jgi:hypothetical protein
VISDPFTALIAIRFDCFEWLGGVGHARVYDGAHDRDTISKIQM